jgi:hypothetical protein
MQGDYESGFFPEYDGNGKIETIWEVEDCEKWEVQSKEWLAKAVFGRVMLYFFEKMLNCFWYKVPLRIPSEDVLKQCGSGRC